VSAPQLFALCRRGDDIYVRFKDEEQYRRWLTSLSDPLSAPIYVDTEIEEDTKKAMLRSMAILRGETDKIDLSLAEYTTDLLSDPTVVGHLAPSMAVPSTVEGAGPSQKYDAFKHRSFIYDDEGDDGTLLSPGLLAMGATTAVKKRAASEDSDDLEFQPTYPTFSAADDETEVSRDEEDDENEEEGSEDDDRSSDGAGAEQYDPEEDQQLSREGENHEEGDGSSEPTAEGSDRERDAVDGEAGAEGSERTEPENGAAQPGSALYKLPTGGSKHREPRESKHPKALPHTNSGHVLDTPQAYKVGSHTRYQKGGDSWIKKESPGGANLAAAGKTPAKGPQPKQIIPASDKKQPLARRHSNMINQCKRFVLQFAESVVRCLAKIH
jgi:hypothetical protein